MAMNKKTVNTPFVVVGWGNPPNKVKAGRPSAFMDKVRRTGLYANFLLDVSRNRGKWAYTVVGNTRKMVQSTFKKLGFDSVVRTVEGEKRLYVRRPSAYQVRAKLK